MLLFNTLGNFRKLCYGSDMQTTWIALLRGINVGGSNRLPMADLRELCTGLGWQNVKTYIASGNVVFQADGAAEALASRLHQSLPFDVATLVLGAEDLANRVSHCPFPRTLGKLVHGFFCLDAPDVDQDALAHYTTTEQIAVHGHTVWFYAPDGFGRSKLAENFHRVVTGTTYTARNLNTIHKLVDMSRD